MHDNVFSTTHRDMSKVSEVFKFEYILQVVSGEQIMMVGAWYPRVLGMPCTLQEYLLNACRDCRASSTLSGVWIRV
jgi:hypothetical protein